MSLAQEFEQTIASGGVALFPADTVYGLACDPQNPHAIERLYKLKQRPVQKSAAVMFFDLAPALAAIKVGPQMSAVLSALMPGPVTVLLPNPAHLFPLACAGDPETLGVRVIDVAPLAGAASVVLQSSANLSGGPDATRLGDVSQAIRDGADLVIDGGPALGVSSTIVDLTGYEQHGQWSIVRQGAFASERLQSVLGSVRSL